jgi:glycosyltransferase involved in cell wall biosynthesis
MTNHDQTKSQALKVLQENRVAIFVVAYNAERHIEEVMKRIPSWIAEKLAEVYLIDDHSSDNTSGVAGLIDWPAHYAPLHVYRTPYNQGYGGNQRLGYRYAIEQGIDIVIMLHGDGQYAPESLPSIIAPYEEGADAVFGSRFSDWLAPLRGGMPFYKWAGNRVLSTVQNYFLGTRFSELHCGYRSYRITALRQVPFHFNSSWFDFDTDIIIQLHAAGLKIKEVPIPTFYGDEVCRVNGLLYAFRCIKAVVKYRLMQYEIFYDPKYDLGRESARPLSVKTAATSLHHFIRLLPLRPGCKLLDVGGDNGHAVAAHHSKRGLAVTGLDRFANATEGDITQYSVDLDAEWSAQFPMERYDVAFALDSIEHLRSPESAARQLHNCLKRGGALYASTGNVAYLPLRLVFLFGFFNYGRRGILDSSHCRLFTLGSFKRLFWNAGFKVEKVIGFGPPLYDLVKNSKSRIRLSMFYTLDYLLAKAARLWPGLLGYQVLLVCTRTDTVEDLLRSTFKGRVPMDTK